MLVGSIMSYNQPDFLTCLFVAFLSPFLQLLRPQTENASLQQYLSIVSLRFLNEAGINTEKV